MKRQNFNACNAELVKIRLNLDAIYYDVISIDEERELRAEIIHSLSEILNQIKGEK